MRLKKVMELRGRGVYIKPNLRLNRVGMEESIASGSATVKPIDDQGELQSEWDTIQDVTGEFEW